MAVEVLRPNADVVGDWTKSDILVLTAWEHIDDAVLDPANARTNGDGDHLTSSTAGQETEVGVGTFALPSGNTVSAARLKAFCAGGTKRGIDVRLLTGATVLAGPIRVAAGSAEAWTTLTYSGSLTQAQIDDLRAELVCVSTAGGGGAAAVTVYAAYIEVDHAAPLTVVGASRALPFALSSLVGTARIVPYAVHTFAGTSRVLSYGISGTVGISRALPYSVEASLTVVGTSRALPYGIRSMIGATRLLPYGVQASVGTTKALPYGIRQFVATSRIAPYSVLAVMGTSRVLAWGVSGLVGASRGLPYNVEGSLTVVGRSTVLPYSVRAVIGSSRLIPYTVKTQVGSSRTLPYTVEVSVGGTVGASRTLVYYVSGVSSRPGFAEPIQPGRRERFNH